LEAIPEKVLRIMAEVGMGIWDSKIYPNWGLSLEKGRIQTMKFKIRNISLISENQTAISWTSTSQDRKLKKL
jgi:ferredoxin-fold anticodon binding domain-containing protein